MKRVIITGASGFIGSNLTRRLLKERHQVHILIRKDSNLWRLKGILKNVRLHEAELTDLIQLEKLVGSIRPEWVFHLAAHGAYSWQKELNSIINSNVLGTANLVQACLKSGFESFINTGSSSEYGIKDHAPSESEVLEPNSCYAVTKACTTMFCRQVSLDKKLNIATLRLYSAYGPYEEPARFIPQLLVLGKEGKLPPLVNKKVSRDFIYIEDVLDAYLAVAGAKTKEYGAVYNVGTGVMTSIGDAVEVARKLLKIRTTPKWGSMENRSWDTEVWLANIDNIKSHFNWLPKYSLKGGLKETVKWFSENPEIAEFYKNFQTS